MWGNKSSTPDNTSCCPLSAPRSEESLECTSLSFLSCYWNSVPSTPKFGKVYCKEIPENPLLHLFLSHLLRGSPFFVFVLFFISKERLKTALCAETRAWCVAFGQNCNVRYRTEMEEIFTFLEDITKRLSRPIKDLDDIRHAMAALKEIRDKEIMIDMSIGPIEVNSL